MKKLIIGLGNPGEKYENTRHNIGFMAVSEFAKSHGIVGKFEKKFNAMVGKGCVDGNEVIIVQPLTFMNLSGEAVRKILDWYKLSKEDILVVYDDIDLDLGRLRLREKGSAGGHNGIKSIIKNLGSTEFARLKLGIGPQPPYMTSENYVLSKFTKDENEILKDIIKTSAQAIACCIVSDVQYGMNKYNK